MAKVNPMTHTKQKPDPPLTPPQPTQPNLPKPDQGDTVGGRKPANIPNP